MNKAQLETITYTQYLAWLYDVEIKIPVDGALFYDDAAELARIERVLRRKEEKSLIKKFLRNLGLIPCNIKHTYEHYDLALTLMNYMNRYELTKEDVHLAEEISFYNKYFKEKLLDYQRFYFSHKIKNISRQEYSEYEKVERELFEKAIPPYGEIDYSNTL